MCLIIRMMLKFTVLFVVLMTKVELRHAINRKTKAGWIKGLSTDRINMFLGVPFAEPPER